MPTYKKAVGTRAQVYHGTAHHTSGGLTKNKLKKSRKTGRIVSKKKSDQAKKNKNLKDWVKAVKQAGGLKKGHFKPIKGSVAKKAREIYYGM